MSKNNFFKSNNSYSHKSINLYGLSYLLFQNYLLKIQRFNTAMYLFFCSFRHLRKPWLPKKKTNLSKAAIKEDTEFAQRVEEIIKNTQPGSEEEMAMIMFSKSSKIQRSPKNST